MQSEKGLFIYKTLISVLFGVLGFLVNFKTIIFPMGDYTAVIPFGLIFPLLIALAWGWKFGLLSALTGGCQTMWWLWGPSNGYALFFIVPPYTLWIVWQGIFAGIRENSDKCRHSAYLVEIPFRFLNSVNLLILARWAVRKNPPPWDWARSAPSSVPIDISVFVVTKQAVVAFLLLLLADVLLNLNPVRSIFRLKPLPDHKRTRSIVSLALLMGWAYWIVDSLYHAYVLKTGGLDFLDFLVKDIPTANIFDRIVFLLFCLISGLIMSSILRRQKEQELDLKLARETVLTREASLQAVFQTLPDRVWFKDMDGRYIAINDKVVDLFGLSEDKIIGRTDYELTDKDTAQIFVNQDRDVISKRESVTARETLTYASDGHEEYSETIKAPVYDYSGDIIGVIGVGRDISLRVSLQNQLIQAQKMESIGRLAGGVAHDFNNMITVILGTIDLILLDLDKGDPLYENLNSIKNVAHRSGNLTRQLLAFARKQTVAMEVLDLNEAVGGMLKMLKRLIGENIGLGWIPEDGLWNIEADPAQIDQVLANLCVNASDAIGGIGHIFIKTANKSFDEDYCSLHEEFSPGSYVMISVSDDGCGMSKDLRERIFDPFYTTKQEGKGTGLGLSTVYGNIKQHKGMINVYSEPGAGSCFKLYFPRYQGDRDGHLVKKDYTLERKATETVMLVEDEEAIRLVVSAQLESLGYKVLDFANPREAVESSRREQKLDLLISDVIMPELNGREVLKKVSELHPDIKCLFVSGYTADIINRQGILDKDHAFLSKPFTKSDLARKLGELLDG